MTAAVRILGLGMMAAAVAVCGAGCTSPGMRGLGNLLGNDEPPAAADPSSTYQVLFVPHEGKTEQVQRTLSGQMHVQDAIEQTGAAKKFRRIDVELVRPLPSGGFHRIPCEYDRSAERITPEFDYALLPGDRILVKEDPATIVDDMLNTALGPFGTKLTKNMRDREDPRETHYRVVR
jgi:hypothetical protein